MRKYIASMPNIFVMAFSDLNDSCRDSGFWLRSGHNIPGCGRERNNYRLGTMSAVNYALPERISDHNPISVDLPFREPGKLLRKKKKSFSPSIF